MIFDHIKSNRSILFIPSSDVISVDKVIICKATLPRRSFFPSPPPSFLRKQESKTLILLEELAPSLSLPQPGEGNYCKTSFPLHASPFTSDAMNPYSTGRLGAPSLALPQPGEGKLGKA
jgi:hypothetical protein